ncbi:MAG: septation ring formation regulator EzrA [Erysipelotrichaceae bacterium]
MLPKDIIDTLFNSVWFYIFIIIVFLIVILLIIRFSKKKKLNKRIINGQYNINELKSHPYVLDIAKLDAIAKVNKAVYDTSVQCKKDYDVIGENIKTAIELLQDANENLETGDYTSGSSNMDQFDSIYESTKQLSTQLDETLASFLNQEALQRKKINELKNQFHQIKNVVNENPTYYTYCWEALDKLTNQISHMFSEFENVMEASQYQQAVMLCDNIQQEIDHLSDIVSQLPQLIGFAKKSLPLSINELNSNYLVALSKGVYLANLNIPKTIDDTNKAIDEVLKSLKKCQIDGVSDILNQHQAGINHLLSALQKENEAFNDINNISKYIADTLSASKTNIEKVNSSKNTEIQRYSLSGIDSSLTALSKTLKDLNNEYNRLLNSFNGNSSPASALIDSFKSLAIDAEKCYKDTGKMTALISENKTEELRCRELVSRFIVVLNESKASIRLSKLSSISEKYNEDIALAENYIVKLQQMLSNQQLDINQLQTLLVQAQNHIINLYKNVNSLIKMTDIIEEYIIIANKYRPFVSEVDNLLYSSELAYRNGEYTKSFNLTKEALQLIDERLADKMQQQYDQKTAA